MKPRMGMRRALSKRGFIVAAAGAPGGAGTPRRARAGEAWAPLVEWCTDEGLSGLECLSGIPGLAGATPIQNVGAYGQDVAETVVTVRAYDRHRDAVVEFGHADCGFGYRTSAFKPAGAGQALPTVRVVLLRVTLRLS